jgi:hypothetical protein
MKAFVFTENNGFIGRFEIASIGDIHEGFAAFAAKNPVKPYSYIECDGKDWTVMPSGSGLVLAEGRQGFEFIKPEKRPSSSIVIRFIEGYTAAKETIGLGNFVKGIGIVVAIIGYILAFFVAREAIGIMASILSSTVTGFIIYVIGAILAAQGRILKATLDTAANTSPNLDEEERAHLMSITPGE